MDKLNYKWLTLCLLLLCAGNASGWAIANKLVGPVESMEFLRLSVMLSLFIFLVQSLVFALAKGRLVFQIIFRAASGLSLVYYMLCLVLPIFWMSALDTVVKLTVIVFSMLLFYCNWREGVMTFGKCWCAADPVVKKHYNPNKKSLDWDKILKTLHISVSLYIPGFPRRMAPALSVVIFLMMVFGLNFKKTFPVVSVFAWGVPCIIMSSTLIQMIAINIAQALKIIELEEQFDSKIHSPVES